MKRILNVFSLIVGLSGLGLMIVKLIELNEKSNVWTIASLWMILLFGLCLLLIIIPIKNKFWIPSETQKLQKMRQEYEQVLSENKRGLKELEEKLIELKMKSNDVKRIQEFEENLIELKRKLKDHLERYFD